MTLAAGTSLAVAVPAVSNDAGNELVGGFEIDGNFYEGFDNTTTATGPAGDPIDWGSAEIAAEVDSVPDVIGGDDESVFDSGAKEDDLETWEDSGSAAAPQNGDIGNVWAFDRVDPDSGDQFAYLAFIRSTDTGSVQWYVELNQLPNTTNGNGTAIPDRSVGDLRVSLENQGGGGIAVIAIESWDGDSWEDTGVDVPVAINDSEITIDGETVEEQLFVELAFNLTEILGEGDCTFVGFSTLNVRSQSGLGANSQLKDYATGPIDIESRCGDIRIEKRDPDGTLLGGATFEITPDPTPGSDAPSLVVTDNLAPDTDPADGVIVIDPAEPGDYTVTETSPPPGYIQTTEPQEVTLPEFGSVTVVFTNRLGTITWSKLDAEDQSALCCATFTISPNPVIGAPADPPLTVVDNEAPDTDPADGVITVEDVKTGTYTITETVPPEGYDLPADPVRTGITVDADTPDVTVETPFEDPRLLSELGVLKLDADTGQPLAEASFVLFLDDGDGVKEAPDGDTVVGDCLTEADGTCEIGGLGFGTYYWFEVSAPVGYDFPADRYSDLIVIDASNAGDEFAPFTFSDPQTRSVLSVLKLDATTGEPLAGAVFQLYQDTEAGEAPDSDTPIGDPCVTSETDGTCSVGDLLFGTYYWFEVSAPPGYELPADRTSDSWTFTPGSAGQPVEPFVFEDPQTRSELGVLKLDADTQAPLAGATFGLYLDDGDGVTEAPDDDTLIGECLTVADGTCEMGDLGFGTYYWFEVQAPTGYDLPADRYSELIVIDASTAGGEFTPVTFTDPQQRSSLEIAKFDRQTGDRLAGATFVVRLDDGDGVFETDEDTVVDPPGEVTTDATGTVTVDGLLFGSYWVEETGAPPGYVLPDPAFQGLFVFGPDNAGTTIQVEFVDPQLPTDLTVRKLDATSEEPLAGATFQLYRDFPEDGTKDAPDGDTLIGECTTGDDGTCTVEDVLFGDYYWFETVAPPGYDLPADPYSEIFFIDADNAGEPHSVDFFDPRRPGSLSVLKLDDADDAPLSGATFDLVLDDGDGTYEADQDTVAGTCMTGDEGTCTIGDLDFGTYFWVETDAPTGYELPENPVSDPIVIDATNVDDQRTPFEFRDPRLLSELSVRKLDQGDEVLLAGAEFDLVLDDGDDTYEGDEDTVVGNCTTGDDGTCTIGSLDFGTYFWVETAAPTGYELPENPVSDPIVIDASNAGGDIAVTVFFDPRVLSELSVLKVDDVDDTPLAGAEFDLVLDDGDSVYEPDEDAVIRSCTTGDDGTCTVDGLDFATFFWVETAAPPGYELPENPVSDPITITAETAGTDFEVTTFRDPRVLSSLSVLKLAEDTEEPLIGGVFELYLDDGDGVGDEPDDGDVLIGECTTGEDGTCTIDGLGFGDYYWFETQAPEGYVIPEDATSDIITISAENAGSTIAAVTFVDPPKDVPPTPPPTTPPTTPPTPEEPELPDTGVGAPALLAMSGMALLVLGAGLSVVRRRGKGLGAGTG
ncbi:MAG TPA: SpaA isopeptide-forming pilin-related protein [Jiangellaceae bacterium]